MTRASLREYAAVQRERYRQATRAEKRQLLDEVVAVTGIHRKAAIRLLRRLPRPRTTPGPGGRPRAYGPAVAAAAEVLWQASGRIGAHRLHPFVPELLDRLLRYGELTLLPAVDKLVRQASRPTLTRLLRAARAQYPPRGATLTRPGPVLKHEIPIRTFTDWTDARPGFLEVDLVAHCGSKTEGFYLCTLCAVDIPTAWIELEPVWGKGQKRVRGAIHRVRTRLPLPFLGLDSDNGSEFINRALLSAWAYGHPRKKIVDLLAGRVQKTRPVKSVPVATGVKSFVQIALSRAIYATGWDGAVTLEAEVNGHWTVLNDQVNGPPGPVSGAGATALLNINTATADQLSTLPMIGLKRARDVVEFRTQHGPFATIDDIIRVPGIGPGTFKAIRPLIRVN